MQTLKPIRVLLEIVAQGSFAGAARSLRMTPASITRIVAQLERDLGQQLLVRTTRQVSLTGAGATMAARYRPLVEEFDRITDDITRAAHPDQGRLAVNAPLSLGMRLLPGLVDGFRRAYPRIELDLQLTDTLVDIVDAPCDLAIRISGPPTDKSTIWRRICLVPRVLVASAELMSRLGMPRDPSDLDPALCLSYGSGGTAETWALSRAGARRNLRGGTGLVSNNGELLLSLAEAGLGVVNLPRFLVAEALTAGRVIEVLPEWAPSPLNLMLYYPPYETLPPLVATFSDFFEAHIRQSGSFEFGDERPARPPRDSGRAGPSP